jgi:hypothetical protein
MIEIDMRKFIIAIIVILIMWSSVLFMVYKYGEDIKNDPCKVCAKRMGKNVQCTQLSTDSFKIPATRVFYPNGSVYEPGAELHDDNFIPDINWSQLNNTSK